MLTTNFNVLSQNQNFSRTQNQRKVKLSSVPQANSSKVTPSAANLKAYTLSKLSFGYNKRHVKKVIAGNKNLRGVDLSEVFLNKGNANFRNADLTRANLSRASLFDNADFYSAKLIRTNMEEAQMPNANFRYAELEKTQMQKAWLSGSVFDHTLLKEVNLEKADLCSANLEKAVIINPESMKYACYDEQTKFPKTYFDADGKEVSFDPKALGMETTAERSHRIHTENPSYYDDTTEPSYTDDFNNDAYQSACADEGPHGGAVAGGSYVGNRDYRNN